MRLIDADMLETELENSCDTERAAHYFVEFMKYVDSQPTVREWIPCSEELPKRHFNHDVSVPVLVTYLGYFNNKPYSDNIAIYNYRYKCWKWKDYEDDDVVVDIVAWMPLPEPYKEK